MFLHQYTILNYVQYVLLYVCLMQRTSLATSAGHCHFSCLFISNTFLINYYTITLNDNFTDILRNKLHFVFHTGTRQIKYKWARIHAESNRTLSLSALNIFSNVTRFPHNFYYSWIYHWCVTFSFKMFICIFNFRIKHYIYSIRWHKKEIKILVFLLEFFSPLFLVLCYAMSTYVESKITYVYMSNFTHFMCPRKSEEQRCLRYAVLPLWSIIHTYLKSSKPI